MPYFPFFFNVPSNNQIELSKEEFAEAMAVKANSDFVEHFFSLVDSDRNGYISFREFLNAVVLFSKGELQLVGLRSVQKTPKVRVTTNLKGWFNFSC